MERLEGEVTMRDHLRTRVAVARRILARAGCESDVAGHVSERSTPNSFWVSPFGYFDETRPEDVVEVGLDLGLRHGDRASSPAISFHAAFYQARPDVNAVIHTHSHYASVLSTTGEVLGRYNDAACMFLDEQIVHFDDASASAVDGNVMSSALGADRKVVVLRNHGIIVVAESLEAATVLAITFEACARLHLDARAAGGQELPREYALRRKAAYARRFIPEMWMANVRRVARDEPGLIPPALLPRLLADDADRTASGAERLEAPGQP